MEVDTFYRNIIKSSEIPDPVSKVIVNDSGAKGDGMASLTQNVTVEFETGRAPLKLFIKTHTNNPAHEEFLSDARAFEKEAMFFMEYLPEARSICEKYGMSELMDIYPKCYYGDERNIVLENVVLEKGYEMMPHNIRHDFETAKLVLTTMANYHGLSHAVIQQYADKSKLLDRFANFGYDAFVLPKMSTMMENFFENGLLAALTITEKNLQKCSDITERLKSLQGKCLDIILKSLTWNNNDETLLVLVHGDFKNNNMMFRKRSDSKQIDNLLLDFQMLRFNAPAIDIVNYLYSSVDSKVRLERLKDLLEAYRKALNSVTEKLSSPANLSYEELFMEYRRKLGYGVLWAMAAIGPGMALMKDCEEIDVERYSMEEIADIYRDNLIKWIDQHPEKGEEMTEEIIDVLNHYKELRVE